MNKIVCLKCGEEFELTDADYLSVVVNFITASVTIFSSSSLRKALN